MRCAITNYGCVFTAVMLGFAASGVVGQCDPATIFGPDTRFAAGDEPLSVALGTSTATATWTWPWPTITAMTRACF